jgi:CRP-like cAMP-binding protein
MIKFAEYINIFKNISIFENLSEDELLSLMEIVIYKEYPKNYTIVRHNDMGDAMFIIINGLVKVSLFSENGREVVLDSIEKGGFFGEMSIIDKMPRSANVITIDDTETIMIKRDDFMNLLIQYPNISINILKELTARLRKADDIINSLSIHDVLGRISRFITKIFISNEVPLVTGATVDFAYTHKDLAARIGTTRESVTRALNKMLEKQILNIDDKKLTIYNTNKLMEYFQKIR